MSKYLVFGWSDGSDNDGPADEFLGTVDGFVETFEDEPGEFFSIKWVEENITLAPYLIRGKSFPMRVMCNVSNRYGYTKRICAYHLIPRTGTKNG